ncbi:hypothetical protein EVG20_g3298 [Dentipellis fragilis]|uniref:Amidohydrolase-related domain-containing protein n=1 Tax=Dentipellis fragilis TaxID=205917 RepID=A0A4Y9Z3E3_9AGAM|nr:hypothetical protein EVG20_g3298 [Dentipellis fragilis]
MLYRVTDPTGHITHFESASSDRSKAIIAVSISSTFTIPRGSFMLPTFCDLHLHAPQFLYQGTGLHLPLMKWLDEYAFKAEERIDGDHDLARRVYQRLAERLIENGTGAVLLFGTIKEETNLVLASVMQQAGIRALVGKLSMDISTRPTYTEHSASASLASAESFINNIEALMAPLPPHQRLVQPVLTPRFVPTCSNELLEGLGQLSARTGVMIQSHLAEARDEVDWVRQERGIDDFEVFEKANLLTPRTVQAHCTYLTPSEMSRLAEHGTSIAHCPLSNAYFSARRLPLREALHAGVKIGLGTDIAGGYSANVMGSMRWAVGVARMREGARIEGENVGPKEDAENAHAETNLGLDWLESMYMATRGGAEALGLECGVFKVGAPFDAQCLKLFDPETGRGVGALDFLDLESGSGDMTLSLEIVEKWWCLGDSRNRTDMWVQGRRLGQKTIV